MIAKLLAPLALIVSLSMLAPAATTIATFADPSPSPAAPDFVLYMSSKGQEVQAHWTWNGPYLMPISLNIPGSSKVVSVFMNMPRIRVGGAGTIDFTDLAGNLVLRVAFDKGVMLANNSGFGASPATGSSVTVSGPGLPTYSSASFAFKFDRSGRIATNTYGIDASFSCSY